jgi:hypothetical protein
LSLAALNLPIAGADARARFKAIDGGKPEAIVSCPKG